MKKIPSTHDALPNDQGGKRVLTNTEKYYNFKTQYERLKRAMEHGYYLEAIVIEYAIMEDRTRAILSYEGNDIIPKSETEFISINKKINKNATLAQDKGSIIGRYFTKNLKDKSNLTDEMLEWIRTNDEIRNNSHKNENPSPFCRNAIIHNLLGIIITDDELKEIAERGKDLCRDLSNRAKNYKAMVERKQKKAQENNP